MKGIEQKLKNLPQKPGVYLFKNAQGEVLYVGKAKNLKNRVRTYFQKGQVLEPRISIMIRQAADLDYLVVASETESLILENNFIKQYHPRYNVRLRDDKNYQFLKIDYDTEIPQIYPVRKIAPSLSPLKLGGEEKRRSRAKYFGPYTSSVRPTLQLIQRIFRLCQNKEVRERACFAYHLSRCPGVCIGKISIDAYRKVFDFVEEFLNHQQSQITKELKSQMKQAARERQFERAAILRDRLQALSHLWEKQVVVSAKKVDEDVLGLFAASAGAVINLFRIRGGRLVQRENFYMTHSNSAAPEILEKFLLQYYVEASDVPKLIFVPEHLENQGRIVQALTQTAAKNIAFIKPSRGKKAQLVKLANENARHYYERELASFEKQAQEILLKMQTVLRLPKPPERIEGYDISNLQGTNPVGSMVVFLNGQPAKSQYRKFKIKGKETPDDFAMMREMLTRRFARLSSPPFQGGGGPRSGGVVNDKTSSTTSSLRDTPPRAGGDTNTWPLPDLIIIDGGKGQLNAALKALQATSHKLIPIIGLAKRLEEIFLPGERRSVILPGDSPVLFLLQQIRDGAHRFAISFHRNRRLKSQTASHLDEIPGIGKTTKKKLLQKFGSITPIRQASLLTLAKDIGHARAKKIKELL
jgi:excinuclease ABC subunit C